MGYPDIERARAGQAALQRIIDGYAGPGADRRALRRVVDLCRELADAVDDDYCRERSAPSRSTRPSCSRKASTARAAPCRAPTSCAARSAARWSWCKPPLQHRARPRHGERAVARALSAQRTPSSAKL